MYFLRLLFVLFSFIIRYYNYCGKFNKKLILL